MDLGQRLKAARLEAGLSQRQLCGGEITRNMLSQIENGTARPSMDTLRYLAARLEKPVSFFLEESAAVSQNQPVMDRARKRYAAGDPAGALEALSAYRSPDPLFDHERGLLARLCRIAMAEAAIREGRLPYARRLLTEAGEEDALYPVEEEKRQLLLRRAGGEAALPSLDEALLLYAEDALARGASGRAAAYLRAAGDGGSPRWNLLMGRAAMGEARYGDAAAYLLKAGEDRTVYGLLEVCFRELGDYQRAYEYACKQR